MMAKRVMAPSRSIQALSRLMTVLRAYDFSPLPTVIAVCGVFVMLASVFAAAAGFAAGISGIFAGFALSVLAAAPLLALAAVDLLLDVLPDVLPRLRRIRSSRLNMADLTEAYRRSRRLQPLHHRARWGMAWASFRYDRDFEPQARFLATLSERVAVAADEEFGPEVGALLFKVGPDHLERFASDKVLVSTVADLAGRLGPDVTPMLVDLVFAAGVRDRSDCGEPGRLLRRFLVVGEAFLKLPPRQQRVMLHLVPSWASDVDDLVAAAADLV